MPTDVKVSLFITCLVDLFFPRVGESMVKVLRGLGVEVLFPEQQTCCGQPPYNSGFPDDAKKVAKRFIEVFSEKPFDDSYIVAPSGSCSSMVKSFYGELFRDDPETLERWKLINERTYEFSQFIAHVLGVADIGARYEAKAAYHDSCHALRELGISEEPRELLRNVEGLELVEMSLHDACCGFGGTFSIKYPEVSASMVEEKLASIDRCGADTLISTDMGCIMQIQGMVKKRGLPLKVLHIAEVLASK